jgi:GDPmannose 4,6-dehydratase
MRALVFGANGQDGYYLAQLCKTLGIECIGISRSGNWHQGDISNYQQVEQLVRHYSPDYIFHLAANSTTRHDVLFENHQTISTGTLNVLEAVYQHSPKTKVFIAGSGLQFENKGEPISEKTPFAATSPYAVARIQSVYAARYYRSLGISTYVGYLFHHESPQRKDNHISKKIILATKRIASGSEEIIELGDITVEKEWAFAGDIVEGILKLVRQDQIFEAVIGTGVAYSIQNWLEECFALIDKNWSDHVHLKTDFTPDFNRLVSDPSVIKTLDWEPTMSLHELACMMFQNET